MAGDKDKGNVYRRGGLNAKLNEMKKNKSSRNQNATTSTPTPTPTHVTSTPAPDVTPVSPTIPAITHTGDSRNQNATTSTPTHVTSTPAPDVTPDVSPTIPAITPTGDPVTTMRGVTQDAGSTTEQGSSSSQRRRGSNKNFALTRLTENGEKIHVVFGLDDRKPICDNRKHWTRHLGTVVRDNYAIKHRTLKWKFLSQSERQNLWQHVLDKFIADDIESYRDSTLRHMQHLWNRWRTDLKRYHIDVHEGDITKITNDKPIGMSQEDWEWLLKNHYFTDQFKKASSTNKDNRKKHKYAHHTGSKPFSQVAREMEEREKKKPSYEDIFAETHKKKDRSLDADAQSRYDYMLEIRERNLEISDLDMAEEVFGSQTHGSVIGMGTAILTSQFRGSTSRRALQQENSNLREAVARMKSSNELFEKSINEKLEQVEQRRQEDDRRRLQERIEMERRMEAMMLRFLGPTPTSVPSSTSPPSSAQQEDDAEQDGPQDME